MNALLNTIPPTLGFDKPVNFGAYNNFLTPKFSTGAGISDSLSQALSGVPCQTGYGYGYGINPAMMNYAQMANPSASDNEAAEDTARLFGADLRKARESSTGKYKVTKNDGNKAIALVDATTEILKKDPSMISESEIQSIEKMFSELNKNPMLAEAFLKEANEVNVSGNGNTSTILGRLEEILTKRNGKKSAEEKIANIKEGLRENVIGRNADLWTEFDKTTNNDADNIEYTTANKLSDWTKEHPLTIAGSPLVLGGIATAAVAKSQGIGVLKATGKVILGGGKIGLVLAGLAAAGALGFGIYKENFSNN